MEKDYDVLKITELAKLSEVGGIEKYYRYQIKTKGGVVLTVDIDEKNTVNEKAAPILTKRAQEIDATLK